MSRPDLEPTQPIPIPPPAWPGQHPGGPGPEPPEYDPVAFEPPPRRGLPLLGGLLRLLLLAVIALGSLVAIALFLTPSRQSILILGSDARPDQLASGEVGRTDTLMLALADRAAPRVALLSIPRDLWVSIPGHGEERINAAYELGGPRTAMQTVSNTVGQPVNHYLVVGLQGVRDVVDAAGGVDITVPTAIHDAAYPTDDYGIITVDIPAGRQHMDGTTALEYARTRHQDNDFARTARQQQVLAALRNQLLNPLNWPRIPAVLAAIQRSVKTDLGPQDAVSVVAALLRSPGDPDRMVIDTSLATEITGQDDAYLLQATPELKPAVARFLNGTPSASIEVLNGAGVAGLASRTADRLTAAGFTIAGVGDAARAQPQTTILAKPGAQAAAQQVAATLGVPASRISQSSSLPAGDIQVTLGADAH